MIPACGEVAKLVRSKESQKNKGILTAKTQRAQRKTRNPDLSGASQRTQRLRGKDSLPWRFLGTTLASVSSQHLDFLANSTTPFPSEKTSLRALCGFLRDD